MKNLLSINISFIKQNKIKLFGIQLRKYLKDRILLKQTVSILYNPQITHAKPIDMIKSQSLKIIIIIFHGLRNCLSL